MRRWLTLALALFAAPVSAQVPPVGFEEWETWMISYGLPKCEGYEGDDLTFPQKLGGFYYDAGRVFEHVAEYTGDPSWLTCVTAINETAYRDPYVIEENGGIPGYWSFTEGLLMHYQRTNDADSREAIRLLTENASFCSDVTTYETVEPMIVQREVAYCLNAMNNAEIAGESPQPRHIQPGDANDWVDAALGHIDQAFVSETGECIGDCITLVPPCANRLYLVPFMFGLTIEALAREYDRSGDSRIPPAIKIALDGMWDIAYLPGDKAMMYETCRDDADDPWDVDAGASPPLGQPASDLNQIIAYGYAWYYNYSANTDYRDRVWLLWEGWKLGQDNGNFLYQYKQFNQSYAFSFATLELLVGAPHESAWRAPDIRVGDTYAQFQIGMADPADAPAFETDCTITIETSGGDPVEVITSSQGLATRTLHTTETLVASTVYVATQACVGAAEDGTEYEFTTIPTPAAGNREVVIYIGEATSYSGGNIAKAVVQYDDTAALSLTETNATCPGACSVTLTLPSAGRWFYRVLRQTAGSATVVAGDIESLIVE